MAMRAVLVVTVAASLRVGPRRVRRGREPGGAPWRMKAATVVQAPAPPQTSKKYTSRSRVVEAAAAEDGASVADWEEGRYRGRLHVRIDDTWYDLTGWRAAHPAGGHWIDYFAGRDATEVMHGLHSDAARHEMVRRLPKTPREAVPALERRCAPVTPLTRAFRELRATLERDGWWQRDRRVEVELLGLWALTYVAGVALANRAASWVAQFAGMLLLAVANTQTGWIAHDYIHGVDAWSKRLRLMGPLFGGMAPLWWSDKHNKHHALTNEIGVDEDIATDPFLFVRPPAAAEDHWLRTVQHWLVPVPFSALFALWRFDSIKTLVDEFTHGKAGYARNDDFVIVARDGAKRDRRRLGGNNNNGPLLAPGKTNKIPPADKDKDKDKAAPPRDEAAKALRASRPKRRARPGARAEAAALAAHWACVLALVPLHIIPQYLLLSGLVTAVIVTATHQSEEMFEAFNPDFVDNQFRTTRDAKTRTCLTEWLWGGMQYQLEHHLFPTMPRSKYAKLQPILADFASKNGVTGGLRISDELDLLKLNWQTYRDVARAPNNSSAPPTRGRQVQAAIPA